MKKLASVFAGLLLCLSTTVFAAEQAERALVHADAAVVHGKAGQAPILVEHAKKALDHALAASLVAKGQSRTHLDEATKSLEDAINEGSLGRVEPATKFAEEAVEHLKAAKK